MHSHQCNFQNEFNSNTTIEGHHTSSCIYLSFNHSDIFRINFALLKYDSLKRAGLCKKNFLFYKQNGADVPVYFEHVGICELCFKVFLSQPHHPVKLNLFVNKYKHVTNIIVMDGYANGNS